MSGFIGGLDAGLGLDWILEDVLRRTGGHLRRRDLEGQRAQVRLLSVEMWSRSASALCEKQGYRGDLLGISSEDYVFT